ncbi:MAG: hypothetical protein ACR2M1_15085 [Gemmatimonadaceae bacterium]
MSQKHVATYLSDHLAGATSAIALMEHIEGTYPDTDIARLIAGVRADVESDREKLQDLAQALGVVESTPREVAGWLGERLAQLKLHIDDSSNGPLYLLEALDGLAMGIDGKLALWHGLGAAAVQTPSLRGADYDHLAQRAQEQRQRIEPARLDASRAVFDPAL